MPSLRWTAAPLPDAGDDRLSHLPRRPRPSAEPITQGRGRATTGPSNRSHRDLSREPLKKATTFVRAIGFRIHARYGQWCVLRRRYRMFSAEAIFRERRERSTTRPESRVASHHRCVRMACVPRCCLDQAPYFCALAMAGHGEARHSRHGMTVCRTCRLFPSHPTLIGSIKRLGPLIVMDGLIPKTFLICAGRFRSERANCLQSPPALGAGTNGFSNHARVHIADGSHRIPVPMCGRSGGRETMMMLDGDTQILWRAHGGTPYGAAYPVKPHGCHGGHTGPVAGTRL